MGILAGAHEGEIAAKPRRDTSGGAVVGRIQRLRKEEHLRHPGGAVRLHLRAAGDEESTRRARERQELGSGGGRVVEVPDAARPSRAQLGHALGFQRLGLAGEDDGVGPEAHRQPRDQGVGEAAEPAVPPGDIDQTAWVSQHPGGTHDGHLRPARARRAQDYDSHGTIIARRCGSPC